MKKGIVALLAFALSTQAMQMDLLEALSQSDALATETKFNIDDRPSTITVLHRDQLMRMGFLTLHDALGILPGIESSRSTNGWRTVTMRGAHNANGFGFDKVKLLIDGVDVTSDLYGTVYYYLDFPVEMIERIEVLRGPASVDYGTGAYAGAINVITRLQNGDRQLFVQGGDENYRAAGAVFNHQGERWRIGVDAYQRSDEASVLYPEPDRSSDRTWGGKSYQGFTDRSAGVLITDNRFYLKGRLKTAEYDNHTGASATPVADNSGKNKNIHHLAEAGYQSARLDGWRWGVKAGSSRYTYDMTLYAYSIDQTKSVLMRDIQNAFYRQQRDNGLDEATIDTLWGMTEPTAQTIVDANVSRDGVARFYAQEEGFYGALDLEYQNDRFQLEAGAGYSESTSQESHITSNYIHETIIETIEAAAVGNFLQVDWSESVRLVDEQGFIGSPAHRRQIASLWFKGMVALSDQVDLAAGWRNDHYRDLDKTLPSYQAGLLYRATGADRFKLMAGHAFRAPSRVELYSQGARNLIPYGNTHLDPETIDTAQIGWHRRLSGQGAMEATLFRSTLRDVIDVNRSSHYVNFPKRTASGLEFGWHQQLSSAHRFQGSLTYLDVRHHDEAPHYNDETDRLHDIATVLGNIAHTWYITGRWSLSTHAQLTAGRVQNHSHKPIDDNLMINETLTYQTGSGGRVRLYVHNLFDSTQKMPSTWGRHSEGVVMPGRRAYLSFTQRF